MPPKRTALDWPELRSLRPLPPSPPPKVSVHISNKHIRRAPAPLVPLVPLLPPQAGARDTRVAEGAAPPAAAPTNAHAKMKTLGAAEHFHDPVSRKRRQECPWQWHLPHNHGEPETGATTKRSNFVSAPSSPTSFAQRAKPARKKAAVGSSTARAGPAAVETSTGDARASKRLSRAVEKRLVAEAALREAQLEETDALRECFQRVLSGGTETPPAEAIRTLVHPSVSRVQAFMRAAWSRRISTCRSPAELSLRGRPKPAALSAEMLRHIAPIAVPVPRSAPLHLQFDCDEVIDETETHQYLVGASVDDDALPTISQTIASDGIPDETDEQSSGLNGGAVASMIELFDAMYDADAYNLGDFATPAGDFGHTSNSARPGDGGACGEPPEGDSMMCIPDECSPTQARIRDDVGDATADSFASPASPCLRELRRAA